MRAVDYLLNLNPDRLNCDAWIERDPETLDAQVWTWSQIRSFTVTVADQLLRLGIGEGDRVINLAPNSLDWAVLDLACSAINAVHVPIDLRFSEQQQSDAIEQIEPKWVCDPRNAAADPLPFREGVGQHGEAQDKDLMEVMSPALPDDISTILFTSGTTGKSRGVMLSHRNITTNALAKLDAMPQRLTDHRLNFLPFAHAYAYTCELKTWLLSGSSIETVKGIEGVFQRGIIAKPTLLNGVPVFYERLETLWQAKDDSPEGLYRILGDRIRRLASGGATLAPSLRSRFAKAGLPIFQGYGLTEASPVVCSNRDGSSDESPQLTEVGPPVRGVRIRIDDQSRLWVSGDGVMKGYWLDPVATDSKLVNGWLDTGDLAEEVCTNASDTTNRSIRILGRADDTIVLSNGYKIEPMRVEQCLRTNLAVEQCLLVGRNRPFPILLLRDCYACRETPSEADRWLQRVLHQLEGFPRFAQPKKVLLVQEPWCPENGLSNFKGGFLRHKIEQYYREQIEELYNAQRCHSTQHDQDNIKLGSP